MASINKSFNFRHGVQVDDKDFTVKGSLVGIGTTIPTEKLDVRGNAVVSGFSSSKYLNVSGVSTLSGHLNASTVGASGSVTATFFYGDGSRLDQLPTSQWIDVDVGLGYTSIYNNGGNVGVGTTDPRHSMQVGGDPSFGSIGVGIHSYGNIHATGVVTATKFVGEFDGVSLDTNPSGIIVTGVATASSKFVGPLTGAVTGNVTGDLTGNVNATDVQTSTLTVAGVTTHNEDVQFPGAAYNILWDKATSKFKFDDNAQCVFGSASGGDLKIFHQGGNSSIRNETGQFRIAGNDIRLQTQNHSEDYLLAADGGSVSVFYNDVKRLETSGIGVTVSDQLDVTNVSASGVVTATSFTGNVTGNVVGNVTGDVTANGIGVTSLNVSGVSTLTGNVTVGGILDVDGTVDFDDVNVSGACTITGITKLTGDVIGSGNLGLGTSPQTDIQIQNAGESAIVFGRSGTITGTNASLRFGTSNGSFPYSANTPESLDIINYGKGNVNFYLEAGTTGLGTGGFYWHRRSSFDQLMVLTYDAKLGIGITVPDNTFHVVGTSTVTDNAWFGLNVNVANNLTAAGVGSFGSLFVPAMTTELTGNVNATTGISTFNELKVTSHTTFDGSVNGGVGIGTTSSGKALIVGTSIAAQFHVTNGGEVGIQTNNNFPGVQLDCARGTAIFGTVGAGTSNPQSGADFGAAGFTTSRHMILPKVTTTQRGNLNGVANGSIIYNTSTNKFQGRANGAWVDLH